jgi:uncharacterized protein (TIGR00106 family)
MKAIADLAIIPIGVGVSLSEYVAACEQILADAGLEPQLHANGTNVEGEWSVIAAAIERCHQKLHQMGAPRVSTNLRLGTRVDRDQKMSDKIESVRSKLS